MLTQQEFASLLLVATPSTYRSPTAIPPEDSARLIALGYIADIQGKLRMTTPGRNRLAVVTPKVDHWTEKLRCHQCVKTGIVSLTQGDGDRAPKVLSISDDFKVVQTEYGPDFYCDICNIPALP
jgi:hypothetical protein